MAKLKPAAKAVLIVAVLAPAAYFGSNYLENRPKAPVVLTSPVVEAPAQVEAPAPAPVAKREPAPEPMAPAAAPGNAGMDALMKGRK